MNKTLKYALIFLVAVAIIGFVAWKYVNKASEDFADQKPAVTISCKELLDKSSNDTAGVRKMIAQLVEVNGVIKKITNDSSACTIELGDSTSMSSIICQMDTRHIDESKSMKEGDDVTIKGKISGFEIDNELGLGNTIQMNYCSPIKHNK